MVIQHRISYEVSLRLPFRESTYPRCTCRCAITHLSGCSLRLALSKRWSTFSSLCACSCAVLEKIMSSINTSIHCQPGFSGLCSSVAENSVDYSTSQKVICLTSWPDGTVKPYAPGVLPLWSVKTNYSSQGHYNTCSHAASRSFFRTRWGDKIRISLLKLRLENRCKT